VIGYFRRAEAVSIAYGFSTSNFECDILKSILTERGIEAVEAGGQLDPGKFAFCTKICSKIIVSQFCIVLANNDKTEKGEVPNANVNIEYGLMLGHNKYVIPFQRDDQALPFNVAGLDTVRYNQKTFRALAIQVIDQAIRETTQNQPTSNIDQILSIFLLIRNATFVNIQNDATERAIFELGKHFGFNLLVKFDGLSYVFLGIWCSSGPRNNLALEQVLELFDARVKAVPERIKAGIATANATDALEFFTKRMAIWLITAGVKEENEIKSWLGGRSLPCSLEVSTLERITKEVSQFPEYFPSEA